MVEGNWLVRRAVGPGSKAAKLAETIELKYSKGNGYVEVSADLCGSATARRILSVVRSGTSGLVLDLAAGRRGHDGMELPEPGAGRRLPRGPDLAEQELCVKYPRRNFPYVDWRPVWTPERASTQAKRDYVLRPRRRRNSSSTRSARCWCAPSSAQQRRRGDVLALALQTASRPCGDRFIASEKWLTGRPA